MISNAAVKCGFSGGIVVDFPNSALAKKYFLVLSTEHQEKLEIKQITGKTGAEDEQDDERADDEDGPDMRNGFKQKRDKDVAKRIAMQ